MSYVERHLLTGEAVTFRTRLHWKLYLLPLLAVVLLLVPLTVLALSSATKVLALLPVAAILLVLAVPYFKRRCSEFAVTNKRVIIKLGVLSTRSIELLLPKIEGITVTQSLGGRMFGYGEIVVIGTGGTQEPFAGIQAPLDFRQAVQAATDVRS
ncbi:MAG TPA: PH domain-containing protein [Gemmatimonadales bacterium]|nr:PH domain-containing protein [Gemmatimonadales bacterium]